MMICYNREGAQLKGDMHAQQTQTHTIQIGKIVKAISELKADTRYDH